MAVDYSLDIGGKGEVSNVGECTKAQSQKTHVGIQYHRKKRKW